MVEETPPTVCPVLFALLKIRGVLEVRTRRGASGSVSGVNTGSRPPPHIYISIYIYIYRYIYIYIYIDIYIYIEIDIYI
jgi:hypothetical protein